MKKFKLLFYFIICFFFIKNVSAAAPTASISVSSSSVTSGQSVKAYVKVNNFTTAQIKIDSAGATTGCSYNDIIQSDTGENITKTIPVTCKASGQGVINISYTVTALNKNYEQANLSGSKSVSVNPPREKDTNNYLKSIGVTGYTLTPEFNKDVMEYSVEVPNTVDKVTLEASPESGYANISGIGEVEVNEGANVFEIKVTSETGAERIYKVNVNVKDENPINVSIGDANYTIMKNVKNVEAPATYEATTVKIEDMDIPAFYSETSGFTLVGVKDNEGKIFFAIYNENDNTYELYNENTSDQLMLYILPITEEKNGFIKTKIQIGEVSYDALKAENADSYLVYAMDIVTGKRNYYIYDASNNSYILYNENWIGSYIEELDKYKLVILGFGGALILCILIITIQAVRKPNKKKKNAYKEAVREMNAKIKETSQKTQSIEEKTSPSKLTKEEAMKKMDEATKMIEEYEKTVSLNKDEIQKAIKEDKQEREVEKKEETESQNKKKKRKEKGKKK